MSSVKQRIAERGRQRRDALRAAFERGDRDWSARRNDVIYGGARDWREALLSEVRRAARTDPDDR